MSDYCEGQWPNKQIIQSQSQSLSLSLTLSLSLFLSHHLYFAREADYRAPKARVRDLQSNFAREADYRAPKAQVRGVNNPYMPRTARG